MPGWFGSNRGVEEIAWVESSSVHPPPRMRSGMGLFCNCHDCFLVDSSWGWVFIGFCVGCGVERGVLESAGGYVSSGLVR